MILAFWILLVLPNQVWKFPMGLEWFEQIITVIVILGKRHTHYWRSALTLWNQNIMKKSPPINSKCQQQKTPAALLVSLTARLLWSLFLHVSPCFSTTLLPALFLISLQEVSLQSDAELSPHGWHVIPVNSCEDGAILVPDSAAAAMPCLGHHLSRWPWCHRKQRATNFASKCSHFAELHLLKRTCHFFILASCLATYCDL